MHGSRQSVEPGDDPHINSRANAKAAVDLVRTIREAYPHLKLIMNRGYVLLPHVIDSIDAVIAESLLTRDSGIETAIPGGGGYMWNKPDSVAEQLSSLMPERDPKFAGSQSRLLGANR